MNTQLTVRNDKNEWLDITDLVISVVIEGDYKQGARKLTCNYVASSVDKSVPIAEFNEFDFINFYQDGKLIFMGTIYEISKDSSNNSISFYAYDEGVRTLKIKTAYVFNNKSINHIMDSIIQYFNIPCKSYIKSDFKITKTFIGKTLYEIIMTIYTELSKVTGKKYMLEWTNEGKMQVVEKGKIVLNITFEEGNNLINSSYAINLDNIINSVSILDENNNFVKEVKDEETIKQYGVFADVMKQSGTQDPTNEAKSMLKGVERTCSLSGFGDYTCITGRAVTVTDSYTELKGLFYIDSDRHTWSNGVYSIDLELNFKNIMNETDTSEQNTETQTEESLKDSVVTGGKTYPAEFTAYYPANDTMQGGFYDAMGNRLDASKLTCACPKEVPFNTKIQVLNTGTDRDSLVYTCTDRGGAIKIVNGVYKIDLLMRDKATAYAFGRRKGSVKIGVEVVENKVDSTDNSSSNDSNIGNKLVASAKKYLGVPYVWGGTKATGLDCSGLTQLAHKNCGINIPRTSKQQSQSGKSVSKSNLQKGDLVFFSTNGTGQVSHVGMYIGNGQMIHAPKPGDVVKIVSINSDYYISKYTNARRYY